MDHGLSMTMREALALASYSPETEEWVVSGTYAQTLRALERRGLVEDGVTKAGLVNARCVLTGKGVALLKRWAGQRQGSENV